MTAMMNSILGIVIDSSIQVRVWLQDSIEKKVHTHTFSMGKSDYLTIKMYIIDVKQNKAQLCRMTALMYSILGIIFDSSIQVQVRHHNPIKKTVPTHTFSMGKSDYLSIKM